MKPIHFAHDSTPPAAVLPRGLVLLLATAAGLSVASLYYSQPMLGVLGQEMRASDSAVGLIPMLTQLGYALGILLLAPLGDRYDRRRIILVKGAVLALALLGSAVAPGIPALLAASFVVGVTATLAQDIVPAAATLAAPAHRGKIVGTVMTGLLLGILLSRVVSGLVAQTLGWRAMYGLAAIGIGLVWLAARRGLPRFAPTTQLPYRQLLGSLGQLWRRHGALRQAAYAQALLSVGFSAFWCMLAVMLHGAPFHLGSAAAGAFGLAGAAGALAAPVAGRLADRRGPALVTRVGTGLAAVSFAAMGLAPLLTPEAQLVLIAVCAIVFDFGVQAALIAHQTLVYGIDPQARSRLNAVLFTCMFAGMAVGAAGGSLMYGAWGWPGVVALSTAAALGAFGMRCLGGGARPAMAG